MIRILPPLAAMAALLLSVFGAQAAVRLKADATGLNDGTSWANAFTNAHDAVAAAIEGDGIVYAAGGKYVCTNKFTVARDIAIYGGFAGASESETLDDRDPVAHPTVFTGDVNGDDKWSYRLEGATKDVTGGFVWDGLTFNPPPENCRYCSASQNTGDNTMKFLLSTAGNVTFDGIVLTGFSKTGASDDGTVRINAGNVTLINCRFLGMSGAEGTRKANTLRVLKGAVKIVGCDFIGNKAGAYVNSASTDVNVIVDCVFAANQGRGGSVPGIMLYVGQTYMTNCLFSGGYIAESSSYGSAAAFLVGSGSLSARDVKVVRNEGAGNALYTCGLSGAGTLENCLFASNRITTTATDNVAGCIRTEAALLVKDSLFLDNSVKVSGTPGKTMPSGRCGSVMMVYNNYSTLLNCTVKGNSLTGATNVSYPEAGTFAFGPPNGNVSTYFAQGALAIANCVIVDNVVDANGAAEFAFNGIANGDSNFGIANSIVRNTASGYRPFSHPDGVVPCVVNSCLSGYSSDDYTIGSTGAYIENVYDVNDAWLMPVMTTKDGYEPQLSQQARSPLARKGRPVFLKDSSVYIYWTSSSTTKPWYKLGTKLSKAAALSGFTKDGPYAADAFGADRKAKSALGPLNTDPLGMLMLVR